MNALGHIVARLIWHSLHALPRNPCKATEVSRKPQLLCISPEYFEEAARDHQFFVQEAFSFIKIKSTQNFRFVIKNIAK